MNRAARVGVALVLALVGAGVFTALGAAIAVFVMAAPSEPEPIRYTVRKGDTLGEIARAHGVTVDDLVRWNRLDTDVIEIGQVLVLHVSDAPSEPTASRKRPKRERTRGATLSAATSDGNAELAMPPKKDCLPPPSDEGLGEDGWVAASGLSEQQLRDSLDGFVQNTLRCVPDGGASGTLHFAITVGCDGRVAAIDVVDGGGLPETMISCVTDTMRFAEFPAHDMPDGYPFEYPLRFEFSG